MLLSLLCARGCAPLGYYTVWSCSWLYVTAALPRRENGENLNCWVRQDFYHKAEAWLLPCLGASGVQYLRKLALGCFSSFTLDS